MAKDNWKEQMQELRALSAEHERKIDRHSDNLDKQLELIVTQRQIQDKSSRRLDKKIDKLVKATAQLMHTAEAHTTRIIDLEKKAQ